MISAFVNIRDGLVYKRGEPSVLEMEALRMELAATIGEQSGLFSVPKLVLLDLPRGTLITEFVPQLKNLREIALQKELGSKEIFAHAGRALATVHRKLQLPPDKIVPLPDYLRSAVEDEVALHGDFCWSNVCWEANESRIVLLDWASAPSLGCIATYGSRYFDLLWFSWSLFFWTPPGWLLRWHPEHLLTTLAGGYAEIESSFQWKRYIQYRSVMHPLIAQYWRSRRQAGLRRPHHRGAELLGWLRWRLFPRRRLTNWNALKSFGR